MWVIGNTNGLARKQKMLRYPRRGFYLLEGLACISLILIGTIVLLGNEEKKNQKKNSDAL